MSPRSVFGSQRWLWYSVAALAIVVAAAVPRNDDEAVRRVVHEVPARATLTAAGTWVVYDGAVATSRVGRSVGRSQYGLVRPVARPCRPGTTSYPAPNQRFNCIGYYADNGNTGHPVLLRQGAAGDFGYLHALVDHGLDEESIATVIVNNAAPLKQSNGRYLYGMRYEVAGVGVVAVEVYEERRPPGEFGDGDGDGLGVVTAFCVGFTGPCPEGINESLP